MNRDRTVSATVAVDSADPRAGSIPATWGDRAHGREVRPSNRGGRSETITALLQETAARFPDEWAFTRDDAVTLGRAAELAAAVSAHLRGAGIARGDVVALVAARSARAAMLAWGIIGAGCVYLPLDPAYPDGLLDLAVETFRPRAILVASGDQEAWRVRAHGGLVLSAADALSGRGGRSPQRPIVIDGRDPAYAVLTSGTTRQPKGVVLSHGGLAAYALALRGRIGIEPGDRCLWTAPLAFSSGMRQSLAMLAAGATLVTAGEDDVRTPWRFAELVRRERVTQVDLVPSHWTALLDASDPDGLRADLATVRRFLFASERLDGALVQRTREVAPASRIWNLYGCTETTGIVAAHDATRHPPDRDDVPIGEPLDHVRLHVVPSDDPGAGSSLVVEGSAVALGYLTADSSWPLPAAGGVEARRFDTGDVVAADGNGQLVWLGRRDRQSKVRGFRVHHDEVEAAAVRCPVVRRASVVARLDDGFVLAVQLAGGGAEPAAVRRWLRQRLPPHMVPTEVRQVQEWPLLPNGKTDHRRLAQAAADQTGAKPCSAREGSEP